MSGMTVMVTNGTCCVWGLFGFRRFEKAKNRKRGNGTHSNGPNSERLIARKPDFLSGNSRMNFLVFGFEETK